MLKDAGLKTIESGSFVSPKWVPQMADTVEIFHKIKSNPNFFQGKKHAVVTYTALTPNMKGLEQAIECEVKEVAIFGSASEAFSLRNINCTIEESYKRFEEVCKVALKNKIRIRGYISCIVGCPISGYVPPSKVSEMTQRLLAMGCYEVSLGDTIGVGTPGTIDTLLSHLIHEKDIPPEKLAIHCHDTYGQALANILVALQYGISVVDSSISGLGGCPYAKGASGNVATEDVVYMLEGMRIQHGVSMPELLKAQQYIDGVLKRRTCSKVSMAIASSIKN